MTRSATVIGTVEFRAGEGPKCRVPTGPVEIDIAELDVTLSWEADDARLSAAIPRSEFGRFLAEKAITLN